MEGTKLLPCPWCGGIPEPPYTNNVGETYAKLTHSEGCCLGMGRTYADAHWMPSSAFEAWNTRASDSAFDALLEAAKEMLNFGTEFDDPRLDYIVTHVDRGAVDDLRAAITSAEAATEGGES